MGGAPLHWAGPIPGEGDPALPVGVIALSTHVSGSALLKRRLDQIGLVDKAQGAGRSLRCGRASGW